jgi:cytochrome P450
MSTAMRPVYDVDFTDPEINHDPYPYLEEMRAIGPVVWNEPSASWIVTPYDQVRAVLVNAADFRQPSELFTEVLGDPSVVATDNPRHDELRSIWGPYFLRGAIEKRADLVREICDRHIGPLLDRVRDGEVVDLVSRLRMVPTEVIARLIGVPAEDTPQFAEWGQAIVYQFDAYSMPGADDSTLREAAAAATKALNEYCGDQLEMRRRTGKADDLLGVLATTDVPMADLEKQAMITMFIEGAQDTTTKFMTNTVAALALHPDQRSALKDDRTLMPQALDEVMRWQGAVMMDLRLARRAGVKIGDVPIAEGDQISPALSAANRDPARWDHPEVFDIFRPAKGNLGFGFGIHNCMGINLAKLEATVVVNKLLDVIPDYQIATDTLDYGRSFVIRAPVSLPLSQ